jgi:hypothetical protein
MDYVERGKRMSFSKWQVSDICAQMAVRAKSAPKKRGSNLELAFYPILSYKNLLSR